MVAQEDIQTLLLEVPDPELPISIVDLGLIQEIRIESSETQCHVHVSLLPTFVGCPALDMIARDVHDKIAQLPEVADCQVEWLFDPPWSVDRISEAGRAQLEQHGVTVPGCQSTDGAVPLMTSAIPCPYCGSPQTRLDSPYGPTRCRSIYFCEACRNQFEHMKKVD